jgi:hypothetical protein
MLRRKHITAAAIEERRQIAKLLRAVKAVANNIG